MPDAVNRLVVLQVLKRCAVGVSIGPDSKVTLAKDGEYETYVFPDHVGKRMLHTLSRKYGVAIHFFWHPEMIDGPLDLSARAAPN